MEDNCSVADDFAVYSTVKDMPVHRYPEYVREGMVGLCTAGTAVFEVFSNRRRVSCSDLVVIIPHQLAAVCEVSDDFEMIFFKLPYLLFIDTMSGMCRMTPDFFFYMRRHYVTPLSQDECTRFRHFMNMLCLKAAAPRDIFRRECILLMLRVLFWDIYVQYKSDAVGESSRYTHKEELVFKFFNLIMECHFTNREVSFYADKLFISPKYLTMVVRDVTGKSAKDWIVEYTILEIKSLLRDTSLDIKDVVRRTGFSSQSLMSRFFRKHTGMSPSQYRDQAHI